MKSDNLSDDFWDSIKDRILKLIEKHARPASEILLDDLEFRELLKISRRTSLNYRSKGIFKYYRLLDGKIYYFLSDIFDGIKGKGGCNGK